MTSNSRYCPARTAGRLGRIERGYRRLLLPEEDCAAFAVRAIHNAEREILGSANGRTTGSGIVEALVRAINAALMSD